MKVVFKPYSVHQQELFPLNLNDLVPFGHFARLIDQVVVKQNKGFKRFKMNKLPKN